MTKLEQKLIELWYECGYEEWDEEKEYLFASKYDINKCCTINITYRNGKLFEFNLHRGFLFSQQDIDNLQQAFNQLQNDLKELNVDE